MTTTTTQKTGFKLVFQVHLSGMEPHEVIATSIHNNYDKAIKIGKEVSQDMTCDTRTVVMKYVIAVPIIETVEVEHINYLS